MGNPFVYCELYTSDLDKAKKFYSGMFDWKMNDMQMGPGVSYTMLDVGEGTGGGMLKNMIPGTPSHWMTYVNVDDVDAATKKAQSLGAKLIKGKTEAGEFGWFTMITDPTGAALALWQAKPRK